MSKRKFSEAEQAKLRQKARKELLRMEELSQNADTMQLLDKFKDEFNICETVYKVVLSEYISQNSIKIKGYMKVNMRQAPAALAFAGYGFDKDLLKNLFGSESTSVKKLRDKVTHGADKNAVSEIVRRQDELFGYMDEFLSTIKNFDAVVA